MIRVVSLDSHCWNPLSLHSWAKASTWSSVQP